MDRYFPVVSKSSTSSSGKSTEKIKKHSSAKYQPYSLKRPDKPNSDALFQLRDELQQKNIKPSSPTITKFLLNTLSDELNPITHSDIGKRADYVTSTSTGHQVSEGQRYRQSYLKDRENKLAVQRKIVPDERMPQVLKNVRIYIGGFLNNTTDIEMKKIVVRAGGQIVPTASGSTHILTSQQLSGAKTNKFLTMRSRNKVHVVKPEWVIDSIQGGRRRSEREYAVIKSSDAITMHNILQKQDTRALCPAESC